MSRIIAGSHRGRRITMPATDKTRPTSDRVREALFSALSSWAGTSAEVPNESLSGLAFCDLYAGSGAVGLEAASRGASPVLLVEADKRTAMTTTRNARELGLAAQVRTVKVDQLLSLPSDLGYHIVFADPPYELPAASITTVLARLLEHGWLAPDGLVVVERPRRDGEFTWPAGFDPGWSRRYGETVLHFGHPAGLEPQGVR